MSVFTVPTNTTDLFWTQTTTLDGVPYLLEFRYNSREACYYLSITSTDGTISYATGIKLVCNFALLRPYALPPGEMMVVSQSTVNDEPPTLGELGDGLRCVLLYFDQADVIAEWGEPERNPGP